MQFRDVPYDGVFLCLSTMSGLRKQRIGHTGLASLISSAEGQVIGSERAMRLDQEVVLSPVLTGERYPAAEGRRYVREMYCRLLGIEEDNYADET